MQRFTEGYTHDWEHQDRTDPRRGEDDAQTRCAWDREYTRVTRPQLHHHPALGYGNNQNQGSLSDCVIIEPPEPDAKPEPTPPPASSLDFRQSPIRNWILQRSKHSTQVPNQARPGRQAQGSVLGNARQEIVGHVCAGEGARQDRVSKIPSPARIQAVDSPEPSTSSSTNSINSSQRRVGRSRARDIRSHRYLRSLEGSSAKLFASAAVLTDRSQRTQVYSNPEFVSRVSRIPVTMAELVTEVEEALQVTKRR